MPAGGFARGRAAAHRSETGRCAGEARHRCPVGKRRGLSPGAQQTGGQRRRHLVPVAVLPGVCRRLGRRPRRRLERYGRLVGLHAFGRAPHRGRLGRPAALEARARHQEPLDTRLAGQPMECYAGVGAPETLPSRSCHAGVDQEPGQPRSERGCPTGSAISTTYGRL